MDLSCGIVPGSNAPAQARAAESLGYKRVWLFDSPALYTDVWIHLARVADATDTIGLGAAVLVPSLRSVLTTASAIAGIELIAKGRLAVAVGTGFTARYMVGQKPLTWKFTEDYIRSLRGLLRGDTVDAEGGRMKICYPAGLGPELPIEVPILVGANGPKGLAIARELGDGVMSVAAPQAGFDWSTLLTLGTVLEENESFSSERVFEALGPPIATIYHGTYEAAGVGVDNLPNGKAWREEIEQIPERDRPFAVHADHMVGINEIDRKHISPDLGAGLFAGTRDQLRARSQEMAEQGLTEMLYVPCSQDVEGELRSMMEAVG